MKVAVVTDSNSGITQAQAQELGIFVLPMPFIIGEETLFEDIDLGQQEFYQKLGEGADVSTSQPSPNNVMELWDKILAEYDEILHMPMSSGLSGSCQTAMMLAEEYEGKVWVADNLRISVTQRQAAIEAKALADQGKTASQIKEILENSKLQASIYITVDTLKYLKKGGRITPAAAALGTLLKIKPVLTIQGDKLDAFAKARTTKQAKTIMLTAIARDLETRFNDKEAKRIHFQVAHSQSEEAARELVEELRGIYPESDIYMDHLALSIACHIGPGALAVACTKYLED